QHLRSCGAINPLLGCVFCNEEMSSAGSVCSHIESGSCRAASHLKRDEVYRFVRLKDHDGVISKNMLNWGGTVKYTATHGAWNGSGYQCNICMRHFDLLQGLNQHLNRHHQSKIYHCPNEQNMLKAISGSCRRREPPRKREMRLYQIPQNRKKLPDIVRGNKWISF
ncbi:hypothetical protein B0T26DRAFT_643774, partial [Lasiosphaeria miniovina]